MMTTQSKRPPLPGGPYLVVGLRVAGSAAARMLAARGERVVGCDAGRPAEAAGLGEAGVEVHLDADGAELAREAGAVVKSPGVPAGAAAIATARQRGLPVIGELELAWRLLPNRFCAVTGTNGKTTVTEWIGHVHRLAGALVAVAGNVGTPLAALVGATDPAATVACECSSFQLEDSDAFSPEVAALLNVTPDHLDRHPDLAAYVEAKLRIFANQGAGDVAVYDADEPALADREPPGGGRPAPYCVVGRGEGDGGRRCEVRLERGRLVAGGEPLVGSGEISLGGEHNARNAMAVAASTLALGIDRDAVAEGLRTFPGVPHRLERVGEIGGVAYVNDSKATNVAAAVAAIGSFPGGVHAILGGSPKGGGFAGLVDAVSTRCRACYLIGEAAPQLAADLRPAADAGIPVTRSGNLEGAVRDAAAEAVPGEVVLLAPACASFDAYPDFERRGEHFRELVTALRD